MSPGGGVKILVDIGGLSRHEVCILCDDLDSMGRSVSSIEA